MPRPTIDEAKEMRRQVLRLIGYGLTNNEIARELGRSQQTIHAYMKRHGLRQNANKNVDNVKAP